MCAVHSMWAEPGAVHETGGSGHRLHVVLPTDHFAACSAKCNSCSAGTECLILAPCATHAWTPGHAVCGTQAGPVLQVQHRGSVLVWPTDWPSDSYSAHGPG